MELSNILEATVSPGEQETGNINIKLTSTGTIPHGG